MPKSKKRLIQAEDLYHLQLISEARISPDGRHVIYSQQRVDQKTEKKYANLWLADVAAGQARQFTWGDQTDRQPRWSPDGSQLAFLSNRGDKEKPPQVYLIPFGGGEARPLTKIEGTIGSISWSPDGKKLLCQVRKKDAEVLEREKDEQKKKLGVTARHYDRVHYKMDGEGYLPKERWHIWTVDVNSGRARQLTDHPVYDEQGASWSPDGKWIAYASNRSPDPDMQPDAWDLFVMPSNGGEARKVEAPVGGKSHPSFSPDGKWIAYYGREGESEWFRNQCLWVVPSDGSAPARNLTEKNDIHASPDAINDQAQPEQMPPVWSKDGQRLYFGAARNGSTPLLSIDRNGDDLQTIIGGDGVVLSFSLDRDQQRLAYSAATLSDPCQICTLEMATSQAHQITQVNRDLFKEVDLGQSETVWFKGPDGNDLQGWIIKPPGFDPAKKYPSILEIHGGPLTQYGFSFMHEFYYLAAQGFVIYFTNPRGGRGYGEAHAGAIWGQWGTVDYDDLMAWTDYIAGQPYIDTARMGVTGGSYGGYMTLWIIGHTQRFKAAVAQRSVSNFISMWGSSDMNWVFQRPLKAGAPFEDLDKHWDRSPMKYIGNARTPTLVIHNEGDLRCPIEQSEQAFVALKRLGVESEMVRFPEEFHGLSRNGRTDRRIARLDHIAGWFKKHL